jgi:hypothetical protein
MHTDATLSTLDHLTTVFGTLFRRFAEQTAVFPTQELPREAAARVRRRAHQAMGETSSSAPPAPDKKIKKLNLSTYKLHAMGDYVSTIRNLGTIDSYSTQAVSAHLFY